MTNHINEINVNKKKVDKKNLLIDEVNILSDIIRKDIEKSYKLEDVMGTEAYYSDRYGWTLRRTIV